MKEERIYLKKVLTSLLGYFHPKYTALFERAIYCIDNEEMLSYEDGKLLLSTITWQPPTHQSLEHQYREWWLASEFKCIMPEDPEIFYK